MPVDVCLNYKDYCLLPNDGKRYEIIDGELFVSPSPETLHQLIVTRLTIRLGQYIEQRHLGKIFTAPFDVILSHHDIVQPDVLYVSRARDSIVTDKNVQGAPNLVIEVLSKNTAEADRTTKLKLYARSGVAEYWIIDPKRPSAVIYRRQEAGLDLISELGPGDSLASPLFPDFNLPLRTLLE